MRNALNNSFPIQRENHGTIAKACDSSTLAFFKVCQFPDLTQCGASFIRISFLVTAFTLQVWKNVIEINQQASSVNLLKFIPSEWLAQVKNILRSVIWYLKSKKSEQDLFDKSSPPSSMQHHLLKCGLCRENTTL